LQGSTLQAGKPSLCIHGNRAALAETSKLLHVLSTLWRCLQLRARLGA